MRIDNMPTVHIGPSAEGALEALTLSDLEHDIDRSSVWVAAALEHFAQQPRAVQVEAMKFATAVYNAESWAEFAAMAAGRLAEAEAMLADDSHPAIVAAVGEIRKAHRRARVHALSARVEFESAVMAREGGE